MQRKLARPFRLMAGLAACFALALQLFGQEKTLWQIGQFDQSSEEFGTSFGFGPGSSVQADPVYRVGQSDWKKDWAGFQPGSANGLAGGPYNNNTANRRIDLQLSFAF